MTRGPFRTETRGMDEAERVDWWNRNGGQVAPKRARRRERLSFSWKMALRQYWGLD